MRLVLLRRAWNCDASSLALPGSILAVTDDAARALFETEWAFEVDDGLANALIRQTETLRRLPSFTVGEQ